jgi:hypothetical protein
MNAPDARALTDSPYERIIGYDGCFFRDNCPAGLVLLDPDMAPETENFLAYLFLEAISERKGYDHYRYADNGSDNGKPDNKTGKGTPSPRFPGRIECNAVCYKACNLQIVLPVFWRDEWNDKSKAEKELLLTLDGINK